MQQLCVIRGKPPFSSCMVSRVMLVKRGLQKRAYKKACAVLQAPNKVDKERATTSQLYNSTKKRSFTLLLCLCSAHKAQRV